MAHRRLGWHLAGIIGIKFVVLTLIWLVFFAHGHRSVTTPDLQQHLIPHSDTEIFHAQ